MTQEERLEFCKVCKNRKLDSQLGFICSLTNAPAAFEGNCADFVKEEDLQPFVSITENNIGAEQIAKINSHSNLGYAILGGLMIAFICAFLWAAITVITEYQIGFIAIVVGLIVGLGVRFFGQGIDMKFSIVGGVLALLSVLLGNTFSIIGSVAKFQNMGYFDVVSLMGFNGIIETMKESFNPMDVIFYGIAAFEGFKFAIRPITADMLSGEAKPEANGLRVPALFIGTLILSVFLYSFNSSKLNGEKQFLSEDGKVLTDGNYKDGVEDGKWTYYYENGNVQSMGNYKMGLEDGLWEIYNEEGGIMSKLNYKDGMSDGYRTDYYADGSLADSMMYKENRLNGFYYEFYSNGQVSNEGKYKRNQQDGTWKTYYESGKLAAIQEYVDDKEVGESKAWFENGQASYEMEFVDGTGKIINIWKEDGSVIISNGNGEYKDYYANGQLSERGLFVNGERMGKWETFYEDGSPATVYLYDSENEKLMESYSDLGELQVKDGNGTVISYYEDLSKAGIVNYKDGLPHGKMESYYDNGQIMNTQNFDLSKLNGEMKSYNSDGTLLAEANYINDLKTGDWKWYFLNGNIESSVTYVDDNKEGVQNFYSENGKIIKKEYYEKGELLKEETFINK